MTTSLKERFEEKFKTALLGLIRGIYCVSHNAPASSSEILAFIKQELELLAEEIEKTERDLQNKQIVGFNWAIERATSIIRNRAKELE